MLPPMMMRPHFVAGALVALIGVAGCGSSKDVVILNTETVERAIEQSILSQRHITAHVTCPSGVHQQKGLTFDCTALLPRGGQTRFRVTETDDKGHVSYVGK